MFLLNLIVFLLLIFECDWLFIFLITLVEPLILFNLNKNINISSIPIVEWIILSENNTENNSENFVIGVPI